MSLIVDEHRQYLADRVRLDAFRRAIQQVVHPGMRVLDLASGTGILGLFACEAGASRVYAIETTSIAGLARDIARASGYEDRIEVIRGHSSRVELPERVDCIVTDLVGHFGFEAGLQETLRDAASRWLVPDGRTIPQGVQLWIAPVEDADVRDRIAFWRGACAGFDVSPALQIAVNTGYPITLSPKQLLGKPSAFAAFSAVSPATEWICGESHFEIERDAQLDGIGGWFVARLADHVTMTNAPGADDRINRRNAVLPLPQPLTVAPGDRVKARIRIRPQDMLVHWHVALARRGDESWKTVADASTFRGFLLSREDLAWPPDGVPQLTRAGVARKRLLDLIDGRHTVREIEHVLQSEFSDVVPTADHVAQFVAEVLAGYAR